MLAVSQVSAFILGHNANVSAEGQKMKIFNDGLAEKYGEFHCGKYGERKNKVLDITVLRVASYLWVLNHKYHAIKY